MKTAGWVKPIQHSILALAFAAAFASQSQAQSSAITAHHEMGSSNASQAGPLLNLVRQATARFKDVSVAEAEGYSLQFGCVSGPDAGAMGLHFVNGAIVASGVLDAARPQIVIYEPQPDGRLKLIGADYLLIASVWDASHSGPPQLMGQAFHYFETPNRFGLPAFYTLHVWAWKENPNGAFVNWHPNVSCQSFGGN
jgi:hypothetical protein